MSAGDWRDDLTPPQQYREVCAMIAGWFEASDPAEFSRALAHARSVVAR